MRKKSILIILTYTLLSIFIVGNLDAGNRRRPNHNFGTIKGEKIPQKGPNTGKGNGNSNGNGNSGPRRPIKTTFFEIEEIHGYPITQNHTKTSANITFNSSGGDCDIDIKTNDQNWKIVSKTVSWVTLNDDYYDQISLKVSPNTSRLQRSGCIKLKSGKKFVTINIIQEGKQEDYLSVIPTDIYVDSNGGRRELSVSASGEWRVSLSAASWVGLTRSGNLLSLNIRPNTYSNARTDYFEISCGDKKQRINVRQEGHKEDYINTSKSYISAPSQGGAYQIDVTSSGYWNISVNPYSWGHLSRSGNTLYLTIDPNDNYSSRSDSFILKCGDKSATVSIFQSAKSNPSSGSSYSYLPSTTSKQHYKTSGYDLYPRRFWGVSFGYVQKEWINKIDNKKYRHGLNGSSV